MPNYDEIKKKAMDALDSIADASVEAYRIAEEKAKILAKKTKLRAGIVNEKATIRRLSVEIGSTYYKLYKDNPGDEFKQLCADVTDAYDRIAAKEAELEDLKNAISVEEDNEACETEPEADNKETED
jgi:predicted  nucleic acid-binding Zn-ribbon protein